ncbi:MAG TPA: heliorhodopsin HeR [Candidatus Saccharimonadales bacterium]|nr:heliorhodopsin HeR [Candidatus Saccharimonadales bacterium]
MATPQKTLARLFTGKPAVTNRLLQRWNVVLAVLYAAEAVCILLFGAPYNVPLTLLYQTRDSLQTKLSGHAAAAPAFHQLTEVNLACIVGAFLLVSALAQLFMATVCRRRYETNIKQQLQPFRWVQFALNSGLMLVAIALLAGARDVASLLLIFGAAAVSSLAGLAVEAQARDVRTQNPARWLAPVIGALSGLPAWATVLLYAIATVSFGAATTLPPLVWWIIPVALVLLLAIGGNLWLVSARKGKWASYAYGEVWYMALAFVAQSLVAWLIYVSVLRPLAG